MFDWMKANALTLATIIISALFSMASMGATYIRLQDEVSGIKADQQRMKDDIGFNFIELKGKLSVIDSDIKQILRDYKH